LKIFLAGITKCYRLDCQNTYHERYAGTVTTKKPTADNADERINADFFREDNNEEKGGERNEFAHSLALF